MIKPSFTVKKRIVTVTLNPCFDRTLLVKSFTQGGTFPVERTQTFAGGKGVNVSRVLQKLGMDSIATGILAECGSDEYQKILEEEGISSDFIFTEGSIRTNITIVNHNRGEETHLHERGAHVHCSVLEKLKTKLVGLMEEETCLVFSGSLPDGLPDTTYGDLITVARKYSPLVFLDASGTALKSALTSIPSGIKPNIDEVQDALGYQPRNEEGLIKASQEFHRMGIEHVVISRGREGISYSRGGKIVCAKLEIPDPVNTVGSGDSAVAGIIIGILTGSDIYTTARMACALGGANTLVTGAGHFDAQDVERLFEMAEVSSIG